jgi:hypothetical protein
MGLATMMVVVMLSFLLYVLIQYPAEKILSSVSTKYLSQDKVLEAHYYFDEARQVALTA